MKSVALLGINLESNAFAPPTTLRDFKEGEFLQGAAFAAELDRSRFQGFVQRLQTLQPTRFRPILFYMPESGGPCDVTVFADAAERIRGGLAEPVDGVFIFGHGAGTTTSGGDLDGDVIRLVRDCVGPDVPVVVLLDLHGNVSELMVENASLITAYRTNPHVDVQERMAESAELLAAIWNGARPCMHHVKLPMILPSVTQGTGPGQPYGDLLEFAGGLATGAVMNVSVLSGFAFSDTPQVGMSVLATADADGRLARKTAEIVARRAWRERRRFEPKLTSILDATALAKAAGELHRPPLLLAEVADNPGGGGRSNTTALLSALLTAGVQDVFLGLFFDRAMAEAAHRLGEGAGAEGLLNGPDEEAPSGRLAIRYEVERLTDGDVLNTRGVGAGVAYNLGPSALIRVNGIRVGVTSHRMQIMSTDFVTHFGVTIGDFRTIVVKSRGHFRAGFSHVFAPEDIFEVDGPGLATPNLATVPWRRVPRPIFPLDAEMEWAPAVD